jgi:hypothetical protein
VTHENFPKTFDNFRTFSVSFAVSRPGVNEVGSVREVIARLDVPVLSGCNEVVFFKSGLLQESTDACSEVTTAEDSKAATLYEVVLNVNDN